MDLLWTNPNCDTYTTSMTVNVDLSKYEAVYITCRVHYSASLSWKNLYVGTICLVDGERLSMSMSAEDGYRYWRIVKPFKNLVWFDTGYWSYNAGISSGGDVMIPHKIYGLPLKFDMLWSNPLTLCQDVVFPAQTINLDLSKYGVVAVYFQGHPNINYYGELLLSHKLYLNFPNGNYTTTLINHNYNSAKYCRRYRVTKDGIYFANARWAQGNTAGWSTGQQVSIPHYIFGVKGLYTIDTHEIYNFA